MKKIILAALLSAACLPALAADSYSIDAAHSQAMFEVRHLGFSTQRGHFTQSGGKVTLDLAAKTGSVEYTIQVKSLDMGLERWNKHMLGEDFFNVEKHPTISFKSTKLVFEGDKVVAAQGDFTLLGVTKPITLKVASFTCGVHPMIKKTVCGADISAMIKRSDFGMSYGLPGIGDEVMLVVPVEAHKE